MSNKFETTAPILKKTSSMDIGAKHKQVYKAKDEARELDEKNKIQEEEPVVQPIQQIKGAKISTAVGTKASVKSMRLDNNLIEAVLYLVNYERYFGNNLKANENQMFAMAIKEFVEKPENAKKINKMKMLREE